MRELTYFPLLESYPKTSGYGYRTDPITGAQGSYHGGVDYGAPWGAPLIAPWDGLVTTGYESGAGNWLWCDAGSDRFKSFHHDTFAVGSGTWVHAGQTIGYIDSTGSSTGSHAHLELWEGGTRIDPTGYLDRAPLLHHTPGTGDDEMTEADWNQMRTILSNALASKFATHSTPTALFSEPGGQFTLVLKNGKPHRMGMASPAEVTLLKRVGFICPQKPENPPKASPDAIEVGSLTADEQAVLHGYPWV